MKQQWASIHTGHLYDLVDRKLPGPTQRPPFLEIRGCEGCLAPPAVLARVIQKTENNVKKDYIYYTLGLRETMVHSKAQYEGVKYGYYGLDYCSPKDKFQYCYETDSHHAYNTILRARRVNRYTY